MWNAHPARCIALWALGSWHCEQSINRALISQGVQAYSLFSTNLSLYETVAWIDSSATATGDDISSSQAIVFTLFPENISYINTSVLANSRWRRRSELPFLSLAQSPTQHVQVRCQVWDLLFQWHMMTHRGRKTQNVAHVPISFWSTKSQHFRGL